MGPIMLGLGPGQFGCNTRDMHGGQQFWANERLERRVESISRAPWLIVASEFGLAVNNQPG